MTHGQRYSGSALGNHGASALAQHQAGNDGSTNVARDGLSISPAREGSTGQAGFGVSRPQEGRIRSWLLLAQTRGVRVGQAAKISPGVLASQARSEPAA